MERSSHLSETEKWILKLHVWIVFASGIGENLQLRGPLGSSESTQFSSPFVGTVLDLVTYLSETES